MNKPFLPKWLDGLYIEDLSVGGGRVDLGFARSRGKTFCNALRCDGESKSLFGRKILLKTGKEERSWKRG